jgi:hypothetical protein
MLVLGAAAFAVVVGGGAAIAAGKGASSSPSAFLDSVAQHLGISSKKLNDAVKAAEIDQVDAALKDGRITKAQADELKARIKSGQSRFLGPGLFGPGLLHPGLRPGLGFRDHMGGFHFHVLGPGKLSAAADYLGLTTAQLREKLEAGQSLAAIAKAQGKSVDGLKNAILDAAKKTLDQAVADGNLTRAQADDVLDHLKSRIDKIVNGTFAGPFGGRRLFQGLPDGFRHFGGPPHASSWGATT